MIEADYGTSHARVFIGSENFSTASLSRNRELGLITGSQNVMSSIASTFAADYRNAQRQALALDSVTPWLTRGRACHRPDEVQVSPR